MELSARWPIVGLCREIGISKSGFYKWKARRVNPSGAAKQRAEDIALFVKYHEKYPSHGYRWLNAKIRRGEGRVMSDQYAHRCCKRAGIKSKLNADQVPPPDGIFWLSRGAVRLRKHAAGPPDRLRAPGMPPVSLRRPERIP